MRWLSSATPISVVLATKENVTMSCTDPLADVTLMLPVLVLSYLLTVITRLTSSSASGRVIITNEPPLFTAIVDSFGCTVYVQLTTARLRYIACAFM